VLVAGPLIVGVLPIMAAAVILPPCKEEIYSWAREQKAAWSGGMDQSGFAQAVAELSRAQDIPFFDLKPQLDAAARQSYEQTGALLWWHDDTHMNAQGHRAIVNAVYEQLLSGLLSEHQQTTVR